MSSANRWTDKLLERFIGSGSAATAEKSIVGPDRESHQKLDTLDFLAEGIYRTTLAGKLIYANRAMVEMSGFEDFDRFREAVNDLGTEWYVDPRRRAEFQSELLRHGLVRDFISEVRRFGTGERMWIAEDTRLVRDPATGNPAFYEGAVRDVTAVIAGKNTERRFEKLAHHVPGGLFQLIRHPGGRFEVLFASPGFRAQLDLDDDADLLDVSRYMSMIRDEDRQCYLDSLKHSGQTLSQWQCEFRVTTELGRQRWLSVVATPETANGTIVWHGYCADISDRKAHEIEIHRLAHFDPLTGLANRRHLHDALGLSLDEHADQGGWAGLLSVDVDRLRTINDSNGHDAGDRVLVETARRLETASRSIDLVARVDGDEFALLCASLGDDSEQAAQALEGIAQDVLAALRAPIPVDGVPHHATGSVGLVVFGGNDTVPEILRRADAARNAAKRRGGNAQAAFEAGAMRDYSRALLRDLNTAMQDGAIGFHLQPQVDRHGTVRGCEALMRWTHAQLGPVQPAEFFPLIENGPTMTLFTQWAVNRAIDCLRDWQTDRLLSGLTYAVNITPDSLTQDLAFAQLHETIRMHRDVASQLVFEITEHVLAHDKVLVNQNMKVLRKLGVQFSIDDFGTGFSSLAYLKKLTFDELKVNGTFIHDIGRSSSDQALVRTILAVAQSLNMRAVAERVETERQRDLLIGYGCELMQGHLFMPALPRDQFEAYARAHGVSENQPKATTAVSGEARS